MLDILKLLSSIDFVMLFQQANLKEQILQHHLENRKRKRPSMKRKLSNYKFIVSCFENI